MKRDAWDARLKELERKYTEQEKTEVHEIVQAENLTPDQLMRLITYAKKGMVGPIPPEILGDKESTREKESEKKEPEKKETVKKAVAAPASQKGKQNKTPSEKEKDHEIKA